MPIQQSGNVTPGHIATWVTAGVLGDGGALPTQERVLGSLNGDFNTTSDQGIPVPKSISIFVITRILVTNASMALTTAAGGFYSAASKTGTTIVAPGQNYTFNTAASLAMYPTLSSLGAGTRWSSANLTELDADFWQLFLALTTPQGVAATADVYLMGYDLSVLVGQ